MKLQLQAYRVMMFPGATCGLVSNLPSTLEELGVEAKDPYPLFLRPVGSALTGDPTQPNCIYNNLVPMSLQEAFPKLRKLRACGFAATAFARYVDLYA